MNLINLIINLRKVNICSYYKLFNYQYILKQYRTNDWENYLDKSKLNKFQKNLIHRDTNFEIFLINWPVEYESKIHNHASNGCLMKILQGNLQEKIYSNQLDLLENNIKNEGDISYIDDFIGYHSINNDRDFNANTIHVYSPPLHETDYF